MTRNTIDNRSASRSLLDRKTLFDDPNNPTLEEITSHVTRVIAHSATVERYLRAFSVYTDDEQHPHDLIGPGNKLEWEIIRGLALTKRDTPERQRRYDYAIAQHRAGQRHHHYWNQPNPKATEEDLKYGAIDAIVSLREPRDYQGGVRSWEEISTIIETNAEHKRQWMRWAKEKIIEYETNPGYAYGA